MSPSASPPAFTVEEVSQKLVSAAAASVLLSVVEEDPGFIFTAPHTREGLEEWFNRKELAFTWLAYLDGSPVGVAGLRRLETDGEPNGHLELCRVAVAPTARRLGMATALMEAAVARASKLDARGLWLDVVKDGAAEAMYRKAGWERTIEFSRDPGERLVGYRHPAVGDPLR